MSPATRSPTMSNSTHLESRVAGLEKGLDSLTGIVNSLANSVKDQGENFNHAMEQLAREQRETMRLHSQENEAQLSRIYDRLGGVGKTNWGALAAWVAVAVTISGGMFYNIRQMITPLEAAVAQLHIEDCAQSTEIKGTIASTNYERGKNEAFVVQTTQKLRDIGDVIESKVKDLNDKVQIQLASAKNLIDQHQQATTEQILDLRKWRLEHAEETAEFRGRVSAKQLMIEENAKRLDERQYAWRTDRLRAYEDGEIKRLTAPPLPPK